VSDRTDAASERVRFLTRWRRLSPLTRGLLVVAVAPLFFLVPYALRQAGVAEELALVLGVGIAAIVAVVVGLVATRTASTPRPPDS
jgi:hypothetical protein